MITKSQAISANNFHSNHQKNADGTCANFRRNGQTQVWKIRPQSFRVPVKRGLREYYQIWDYDAENWHLPEDCPCDRKEN